MPCHYADKNGFTGIAAIVNFFGATRPTPPTSPKEQKKYHVTPLHFPFWNGGVFSMIENLSDTVTMPIAGIILTFVMCYEPIQMVIDRNNMHDFPPSDIFKWMMKTFIAVVLVTNTFPIMMGIFDVAQSVISNAAGVILTDTAVGVETLDALRESLMEMDIGPLLGLYLQSFMMELIMWALTVCIFIIVYGRMLEIYQPIHSG